MESRLSRRQFAAAAALGVPALASRLSWAQAPAAPRDVLIAGGIPSGTFNEVGQAICSLMNARNAKDFVCKSRGSAGSSANVNSVGRRLEDFGLAQADIIWFASNGTRDWEGKAIPQLRTVLPLFFQAITLVTRTDTGIRAVADLRGKVVSVSNPGSGSRLNALDVLAWHGLAPDRDFTARSFELSQAVRSLIQREIDAFFFTVGHPTAAITQAAEAVPLALVPIDGPPVAAALRSQPYYRIGNLPGRHYRGVTDPVRTVGVRALLFTHESQSPDTVYAVTKTLAENWDQLRALHAAVQPLGPEDLARQPAAPFHPGAVRYFRERGYM